jgi:hypothetical protein
MFTVDLDVTPLIQTVSEMLGDLKAFPNAIGDELTQWQKDDMHRKFPNTAVVEDAATTSIWSTSRTRATQGDKKKVARIIGRQKKGAQVVRRVKGPTRPILRLELYNLLVTRMDVLLKTGLNWEVH